MRAAKRVILSLSGAVVYPIAQCMKIGRIQWCGCWRIHRIQQHIAQALAILILSDQLAHIFAGSELKSIRVGWPFLSALSLNRGPL